MDEKPNPEKSVRLAPSLLESYTARYPKSV